MMQISNLTPDNFGPGGRQPGTKVQPRKRQRKVLSCDSCHRQKVRCDRQQPCQRCIAGNRAESCHYTSLDDGRKNSTSATTSPRSGNHPSPSSPTVSSRRPTIHSGSSTNASKKSISTSWKGGRARFSGLTHWMQLAFQYEEAVQIIRSDLRELGAVLQRLKNMKNMYLPRRSRAFPFGDAATDPMIFTRDRLGFLPNKLLVEQLVESYLNTWEVTHPLLLVESFREEMRMFWKMPDRATSGWLAQLYLMLALSCYSASDISFTEVSGGYTALANRCIDGAELAFLSKGAYMSKPDLTTLRALTMLHLAKRIDIVSGDDSNGQWVSMGFVTRTAMSMKLHIDPDAFPQMPAEEATARRRLWNTLVAIDATVCLDAGMPLVLSTADYSMTRTGAQNHQDGSSIGEGPLLTPYENQIAAAIPILSDVLNRVNSPDPGLSDEQIEDYTAQITHHLEGSRELSTAHRSVLEVLLRRCLCALHQVRGSEDDFSRSALATASRRTIWDCVAAMSEQHRLLSADPPNDWLLDFFSRDVGIIGLHGSTFIRRRQAAYLFEGAPSPYGRGGSEEEAKFKETTWRLLRSNRDFFREKILRSRHYFKIARGYSFLFAALEAQERGSSVRDALFNTALETISLVEVKLMEQGIDVVPMAAREQGVAIPEMSMSSAADMPGFGINSTDGYGATSSGEMLMGNGYSASEGTASTGVSFDDLLYSPTDSFDEIPVTFSFNGLNFNFSDCMNTTGDDFGF